MGETGTCERGPVPQWLPDKYMLQVPSFEPKERGDKGGWEDRGIETLCTSSRNVECCSCFGKTDSDSLETKPRIKGLTQRKEYRAL